MERLVRPYFKLLVASLSLLGILGCSITQTTDDQPLVEAPIPEVSLTVPQNIPDDAGIVLRFEAYELWPLLEEFGGLAGFDTTPTDAAIDPVDALLRFMLHDDLDAELVLSDLEHANSERPMVLAIHWGQDQRLLDQIRNGTPMHRMSLVVRGFRGRWFLPSDSPAELVEEIGRRCGSEFERCPRLEKLFFEEEYAVIEVNFSDCECSRDVARIHAQAVDDGNPHFFDRPTPAARKFLKSTAMVTAYARDAALLELAMLLAVRRGERNFKEQQGGDVAGELFDIFSLSTFEAPEAREFEDLSLSVRTEGEQVFVVDLVQTHSAVGRSIYEAGVLDLSLPSIAIEEPAYEFEWSADLKSMAASAVAPEWLYGHLFSLGHLVNVMNNTDRSPYGNFHVMAANPMGFLKVMIGDVDQEDLEDDPQSIHPMMLLESVQGARASLAVIEDPDVSHGYRLDGGIAIAVLPGALTADHLEAYLESMVTHGLFRNREMHISKDVVGGLDVFRIGAGDHEEIFGEATSLGDTSVTIDLSRIPQHLLPITPLDFPLLTVTSHPAAELQVVSNSVGRASRISLGAAGSRRPWVSEQEFTPFQGQPLPSCRRYFARESVASYYEIFALGPDFGEMSRKGRATIEELERLRADCDLEGLEMTINAWEEMTAIFEEELEERRDEQQ